MSADKPSQHLAHRGADREAAIRALERYAKQAEDLLADLAASQEREEKLREALREIAGTVTFTGENMRRIARAALSEKGDVGADQGS